MTADDVASCRPAGAHRAPLQKKAPVLDRPTTRTLCSAVHWPYIAVQTVVIAVIIVFCLEWSFVSCDQKTTFVFTGAHASARCSEGRGRPSSVQPPIAANGRASVEARNGLQAAFRYTRGCRFRRIIWDRRYGICGRQPDVAGRRGHRYPRWNVRRPLG